MTRKGRRRRQGPIRAVSGRWCSARHLALTVIVGAASSGAAPGRAASSGTTSTPIKHLVVIFQENVSFDHYFGTYPQRRQHRRPAVHAAAGHTRRSTGSRTALLHRTTPTATNPRRYDPANINDVLTCDQDHNYTDEQRPSTTARWTGSRRPSAPAPAPARPGSRCSRRRRHELLRRQHRHRAVELRPALRDERQLLRHDVRAVRHRARSTWSPATPAASTWPTPQQPGVATAAPNADLIADGSGGYSLTSDAQPYWDDCSTRDAVAHDRHEHRRPAQRAGPVLGLVRGRLPADDLVRRRRPRPAHRPADRDVHPGRVQERRLQQLGAALVQPGHLQRRAPGRRRTRRRSRRAPASTATRTTTSRTTSRSSTTPRPPTRTTSRCRRRHVAALRRSAPTPSTTSAAAAVRHRRTTSTT